MAKTVIFKSPVRFGGQRYPAGTEMELDDRVIKSLPNDVYDIKALPEPAAADVDPVSASTTELKVDKADKPAEKAK